ncbi:hypothetical protein [Nocardioides sp. GXQ0305]|uniref:hypothetical protein n=1 Tax=Nocardioides sp. GXQ0305 TaxID=3423912 RepID=UPI003D7E175F
MASRPRGLRPAPIGVRGGSRPGPPTVLVETAGVVWGSDAVAVTRRPHAPDRTSDWMVLPRFTTPRWLLPARGPTTAAALVGPNDSGVRGAAARILAALHRTGAAHRLPVRRLRVPDPADGSLVSALVQMVGADCEVAIRLGSWEHARSLVVRLFDADGATRAFGKVGIDERGRSSVTAEAAALARVAELDLTHVVHSRVVHHEAWRDLEVLLVTPLLPPRPVVDDGPPVAAMRELAESGGARTSTLAGSAWWSRVLLQLDELANPTTTAELRSHVDRLAQASGQLPVRLGPAHGDWTPWNMARAGSRVLLWDWEHFGEDVPVGFDLVHYLAQELRVASGTGPTAEARWLTLAADGLERHVGLGPEARDLVVAAYLLDVNLRFLLDRQGTPQADQQRRGWGRDLLRRRVAGLGSAPG